MLNIHKLPELHASYSMIENSTTLPENQKMKFNTKYNQPIIKRHLAQNGARCKQHRLVITTDNY